MDRHPPELEGNSPFADDLAEAARRDIANLTSLEGPAQVPPAETIPKKETPLQGYQDSKPELPKPAPQESSAAMPPESPFASGQALDPENPPAARDSELPNLESAENDYQNPLETAEEQTDPIDHRVTRSSWHRIELDPRTGRPLNNPELEYGQAFRQEQSPEAVFGEQGGQQHPFSHDEEDEVAAASGQVAVDNSPDVGLPGQNPLASSNHPQSPRPDSGSSGLSNNGIFRQSRSPLSGANVDDILLWAGVALVILAIILAIVL
jgi:hypothetical protein